MVFMQLEKGRGKTLSGAVNRDRIRGRQDMSERDCCWGKSRRKQGKRGVEDKSVTIMRLMKSGGEIGRLDAVRYSIRTSKTTSARMNEGKSICRGVH